jgi:hypothetical protein
MMDVMKNHVAQPAASSRAVLSGYPSVAPNIEPKNWQKRFTPSICQFHSAFSVIDEVHTSKLAHELKENLCYTVS